MPKTMSLRFSSKRRGTKNVKKWQVLVFITCYLHIHFFVCAQAIDTMSMNRKNTRNSLYLPVLLLLDTVSKSSKTGKYELFFDRYSVNGLLFVLEINSPVNNEVMSSWSVTLPHLYRASLAEAI